MFNRARMSIQSYLKAQFALFVLISICFNFSHGSAGDYCLQKGPCNCTNRDGSVLDLSPLSSRNWPLVATSNSYLYMYQPCKDVPLNSVEDNVCNKGYGLCYFKPSFTNETVDFNKVLRNESLGTFEKLALNAEAVFQINDLGETQIVYKNALSDDVVVTTIIILECNQHVSSYKLTLERASKIEHVLRLVSKSCCPISAHHMSGTAVFFLILVIIFSIYFVGGILVLKFLRGAKGVEVIPNHEFWCRIPVLTMDAFNYIKNCFQPNIPAANSYEKI